MSAWSYWGSSLSPCGESAWARIVACLGVQVHPMTTNMVTHTHVSVCVCESWIGLPLGSHTHSCTPEDKQVPAVLWLAPRPGILNSSSDKSHISISLDSVSRKLLWTLLMSCYTDFSNSFNFFKYLQNWSVTSLWSFWLASGENHLLAVLLVSLKLSQIFFTWYLLYISHFNL